MEEESVAVVVTTVLADFYAKHPAAVLLPAARILSTLLKNATTKEDEKFRKARLSNQKIQQNIVQVSDALDILALAGFAASSTEDCLVYTPPNGSHEIAQAICHNLETKIQELELCAPPKKKPAENDSPFLSAEERKKRLQKAKAARKAHEAQRAAEQRRWEEDKKERQEIARLKEQAAAAASIAHTPVLAQGVSVRPLAAHHARNDAPPPPAAPEATAAEKQVEAKISDDSMNVSLAEDPGKNNNAAGFAAVTAASVKSNDPNKLPVIAMPPQDLEADDLWKTSTANLSTCEAATGIRDSSIFKTQNHPSDARPVTCLKRLFQELKELSSSLPKDRLASIWIRFDEDSPQYLRAILSAPLRTPYAGGLFCFDIFIPNDYPSVPPSVTLLTTGGGRVRFGPNLYADGTVCLSLLGTWPGPKWSPSHSNLYQVLVSIQGLILGAEQPWFLEPGHGGWEGDIKEGEYVKEGHTLATGEVVRSEVGLPPHIRAYNNVLRAGTVKFAMLETLSSSQRHLKMFEVPVHAHFFCSRSAILKEVQSWSMDFQGNIDAGKSGSIPFGRMPGDLKDLLPKLEGRFSALVHPSGEGGNIDCYSDYEEKKMPAATAPKDDEKPASAVRSSDDPMQVDVTTEAAAPTQQKVAGTPSLSEADNLRTRMQEAAALGNYAVAGKLQEQLNQLEDLERRMKEAASEGNFIRAGRLQEQIEALMNTDDDDTELAGSAMGTYDASAQEEDGDSMMGTAPQMGGAGMAHAIGGLIVGKNVFVPPGHPKSHIGGSHHDWGSGSALNSTTQKKPVSTLAPPKEATAPNIVIRKPPPSAASQCRLRFRLPEGKTCLESFGRNDPLSNVYGRLESILSTEPNMEGVPRSVEGMASPLRTSGAWAHPQSAAGFTLLLSHPKREFCLEMYGTKTLSELGLVPSATLTVMKCADRGVAFRGELESRLTAAQGNAMDVEGLTYEGLVELTERVGAAAPEPVTTETLDRNSTLLSPSSLEMDTEEDGHCLICLGEFDPSETNNTVRKLHQCGHIFHAACFATWLKTKANCPLCKSSIAS